MDSQTLIDNFIFLSLSALVIWLVWESHKPTTYFRAHWYLLKRNYRGFFARKAQRKPH
ncbi:hypothetical protein AAFX24_17985 [Vibrio mediterranei]|uniref:hypothetical protein n=1 Tax=Vibrio mediterranei TaxID=689 RepID=UPI0038CDF289